MAQARNANNVVENKLAPLINKWIYKKIEKLKNCSQNYISRKNHVDRFEDINKNKCQHSKDADIFRLLIELVKG